MVLTGYNTDIEHGGATYHVQTEDKGRSNPLVESLVYARGEILYSRRTSYQDLVAEEVDSRAIATLMERQHRTIVEAIRRGRLAQLVETPVEVDADDDTTITSRPSSAGPSSDEPTLDEVILSYLEAQRERAHLVLRSAGDNDFVYGRAAAFRITAVESHSNTPVAEVRVTVLFKSTSEPRRLVLAEGETDGDGVFAAEAQLPSFNGGTSAVVITAESDLGQSEIKHLVHR